MQIPSLGSFDCVKDKSGMYWFDANRIVKALGYAEITHELMEEINDDDLKSMSELRLPEDVGNPFYGTDMTLINKKGILLWMMMAENNVAISKKQWLVEEISKSDVSFFGNESSIKIIQKLQEIFELTGCVQVDVEELSSRSNYKLDEILDILDPDDGSINKKLDKILARLGDILK